MNTTNKVQPGCPFCLSNALFKGEITTESAGAFLTKAGSDPDNYLIIPKNHYESVTDLPDDWWVEVKQLVPQVPELKSDYNLSMNLGTLSGQTVKHLHFWVIVRRAGLPSSGKGLARFIADADHAN
ncbi:MAG TPA: HIT domain-containing protein [Candidatus Saccharimonadales bacterium]|nr:HIT domain-containing protein [Candidatus Saccharimonadales bacterium]